MDLYLINRRLRDNYGIDIASDQQKYRIVWSEDMLEKRRGLFTDYVPNTNILIRTVHEIRLVKKYQFEPQYVLEHLIPNVCNSEINERLSYEPLWTFGDKRELVWRAIELLIKFIQNPRKPFTEKELEMMEAEQILRDEQIIDELLQENMKFDAFHSSVQDGDSVILSKTDYWDKK